MKYKSIVVLVVVTVFFLIIYPTLKRATISALFFYEVLKGSDSILASLTEEPRILEVRFKSSIREIKADLYLPSGKGKSGGIVLVHGLVDTGKDDPRLIHLAKSLSRAGWVTLVPDFEGMRAFKIRLTDIDEIVDSFLYLFSHERVKKDKVGILGFSYGAGPTILSAIDHRIRERVSFIVSFGGYYDIRNLIRFVTTGTHDYKEEKYFLMPMDYAKWAFLQSNLDFIKNENDRRLLKIILEKKTEREGADLKTLSDSLGPEGRAVFNLITNKDPHKVDSLISELRPELKDMMDRLSIKGKIGNIRAQIFLVHGRDDDAIPFTESLKMADDMKDKKRLHLYILKIFVHVDPLGRKTLAYVPSVFKFYSLVYNFMGLL